MIRALLLGAVVYSLWLCGIPVANAAMVAIKPGPGVAVSSSGITTAANFVGSFSAAAFNTNFTTAVGGTPVTMPATMRLAANAGNFAANAVRFNPLGLIGAAVGAWLLQHGIEYAQDHWNYTDPNAAPYGAIYGWQYIINGQASGYSYSSCESAGQAACSAAGQYYKWANCPTGFIREGGVICGPYSNTNENLQGHTVQRSETTMCPNGGSLVNGSCVPAPVPATDQNWAAPAAAPLPDPVATELAKAGLPLPLKAPEYNPAQHQVPMSDPYVDPITGKRYQDKATVTPQSNAQTANVQVTKVEVNPDGTPKTNPETGQPNQENKTPDECELNPDRIGCKDLGEPDDQPDLEKKKIGVETVTPVTFASNASCPADIALPKGATFSFEWPCRMAEGLRPFILAIAWLIAGFIVIGVARDG